MMKGINDMKKIISVMLLGSLLVTGAVVYADTLSSTGIETNKDWAAVKHLGPQGEKGTGMLAQLVTDGVITAEEQAVIEKAMTAHREAAKAEASEAKTPPAEGTERLSPFAELAKEGLIDQALADKIDGAMKVKRDADFATDVKPLVDAGTFSDTAAVQSALDAVHEAMRTEMDALKPDTQREKVDFKTMTEAERTAFKEKMDAQRTAMEAKHEAAENEVYSSLVSAGTLTQAQADALEAFQGEHQKGGRGPEGNGFGGDHHGGPRP